MSLQFPPRAAARLQQKLASLTVLLLMPTVVMAHPDHDASSLIAGLLHPLSSAEHAVAMLALGWWTAQLGGRARVVLPVIFMAAIPVGAMLGGLVPQWGLEALPVGALVLSAAVMMRWRPALVLAAGLVGCLALLQGWSHAPAALPSSYLAGLWITCAILHAAGLLLGMLLERGADASLAWERTSSS